MENCILLKHGLSVSYNKVPFVEFLLIKDIFTLSLIGCPLHKIFHRKGGSSSLVYDFWGSLHSTLLLKDLPPHFRCQVVKLTCPVDFRIK